MYALDPVPSGILAERARTSSRPRPAYPVMRISQFLGLMPKTIPGLRVDVRLGLQQQPHHRLVPVPSRPVRHRPSKLSLRVDLKGCL